MSQETKRKERPVSLRKVYPQDSVTHHSKVPQVLTSTMYWTPNLYHMGHCHMSLGGVVEVSFLLLPLGQKLIAFL